MTVPRVRRRGAARRSELLAGLVEIFLAEGFRHLSMDDLAARLRCSKTTLYAVASSKQDLQVATVREFFRSATAEVEARVATVTNPAQRLRVYLDAISLALSPATGAFYSDVNECDPTRVIYEQNTNLAARRVHQLVSGDQGSHESTGGKFLGAVVVSVMRDIQSGAIFATAGVSDADGYRMLADLIQAGTNSPTVMR